MVPVSIVIITKNEADTIAGCIERCRLITDDIVVVDNESADDTPGIAGSYGCRVYKKNWNGYGANKNKGIEAAKYDWILSIDADELPDAELLNAIHRIEFVDPGVVYDLRFRSYFGKKLIRFGSWGRDHHIRLFNRKLVKWSETMVHETLIIPGNVAIKKLPGYIHHYSAKDAGEYAGKAHYYAKLSAKKYFKEGKKAGFIKLYLYRRFLALLGIIFFIWGF